MSKPDSKVDSVVLDSTVFIADYWLRSPSFVLFREFLKKAHTTLVVPQVVLEEVINHHREDVEIVRSELRRAHREIARLLPHFSIKEDYGAAIYKAQQKVSYKEFLNSELKGLGTLLLDYSEIPHKDVVSRDLRRKRPFQQSGKGYGDTLLWETVLRNCVKKGAVTVLISQNRKDFCGPDGKIHKDLELDLFKLVGSERGVEFYNDLPQFTDAHVVPFLAKRKDFAILVENKKFPGLDLEVISEQNTDLIIEAINNSPSCMIGDPDSYEPEVDVVSIPKEMRVVEISEILNELLLVVFEFQAEVAFIYFLPKSDYFTMSEKESASIAIVDADWNESVMQVESTGSVDLKCRLTFNTETRKVESFEVENVEGVYGEH